MSIEQNVQKYSEQLKNLGIENTILEHPASKNIDEVVNSLGITRSDSAATLVMQADGQFISVIRRDDTRLDLKKIKKLLNVEDLRIATHQEFSNLTGLQPGAATYCHPNVKKTLIDKKVLEKEYIVGGSGSFSSSIRHKTQDLTKIPGSKIVDISEKSLVTAEGPYKGVKRVLSGIRATGRLHLGNYLGAVKGMLQLQENPKYETLYMVADSHTVTTPYKIEELRKNRREVIIDYLTAGLDPKKSIIFQQANVSEHIELAFYFSSVVTIAKMQHLPTFKEKVKLHPGHSTMALLNYPILMAADILVYKAELVPVGIDQEPHLEVAREIARKMNLLYGMDFPEPKRFATKGEYVPSLKGEGKMGKSVEGSFINLTDSEDDIRIKVRSIPTATTAGGEMSPGVKALFAFADLYISSDVEKYKKEFEKGTLQFVTLKDAIAEAIYKELEPFQEKRKELEAKPEYVAKVIKEGAEKAHAIASQTVKEVRQKMGLL